MMWATILMIQVLFGGEIHALEVEEYLRGVVPAEVYPDWPEEVLKAQAVLARSYGMWRRNHPRRQDIDLYSDNRDQMYEPELIHDCTDAAVKATEGWILVDAWGEPFKAEYNADTQWQMHDLAEQGWEWRRIVLEVYQGQDVRLVDIRPGHNDIQDLRQDYADLRSVLLGIGEMLEGE